MSSCIGIPLFNGLGQGLCCLKEHLFQFLIEPGIVQCNGHLIGQGGEKGKILLIKAPSFPFY